jgi:ribosomal-protein-alanine N-acetyltransferase
MLAIMESELGRAGVKKIFLEVAADNAAAIALYERAGFARIAVRPKYYNGAADAVVMSKNLLQ